MTKKSWVEDERCGGLGVAGAIFVLSVMAIGGFFFFIAMHFMLKYW